MMSIVLLICCVWENHTVQFYNPDVPVFVVLLTKPDDPVSKLDCPILVDLAYVSPILFVVFLLSCASRNTCSHTQNCCTYQMHRYRGCSLRSP
jgi:hypothetical protein